MSKYSSVHHVERALAILNRDTDTHSTAITAVEAAADALAALVDGLAKALPRPALLWQENGVAQGYLLQENQYRLQMEYRTVLAQADAMNSRVLQENGDLLLQEDGSRILQERRGVIAASARIDDQKQAQGQPL